MRRLDGIIESALPPHKNVLWLDKGVVKYYRNGKWATVIADSNNVSWESISGKPKFASVATSGSYNDLNNTPAKYVLPAAGTELGGVKIAVAVPNTDITDTATAQTVGATLNALLAALRASGVLTS